MKKIVIFTAVLLVFILALDAVTDQVIETALRKTAGPDMTRTDENHISGQNVKLVAVFGMDHDSMEGDWQMERSDAVKIISVSSRPGIVSLQRDLLVYLPEPVSDFSKLNHACWQGGADLALRTLRMNFDLDISRYVCFSFRAVETLAGCAGGVDLELSAEEAELVFPGQTGHEKRDMYHLDPAQVMAFCRIRVIDSDFARMERQERVMKALSEKMKRMSFSKLLETADAVMPDIETNLSVREMKYLLLKLMFVNSRDIRTFRIPENGIGDVEVIDSYGGYGPLYRLKDKETAIRDLHVFLYGEGYEMSDEALRIEEMIIRVFGG